MSTPKKFRVWDGEEMHEPPHAWYIGSLGVLWRHDGTLFGESDDECWVPSVFTGLTDAEGTEIYEGDVLGFPNQEKIMLVVWDSRMQAFRGQCSIDEFSALTWPLWEQVGDKARATVIGNRYENPDLLNQDE